MAFSEERFPVRISLGAQGGPVWVTNVVRQNNGFEYRNRVQSVPLSRWDVSHAARTEEQLDQVRDFHYVMGGRATAFRFKDWTDYRSTVEQGVFEMLTATTFQMVKRYAFGALSFDRPIYKPVWGTVAITGGTVASVDYTTGIVTMTVGSPTDWRGEFDIPARFDIDDFPTVVLNKQADGALILGASQIPIIETRDIA